jgi:hypothetical protein
MNDWARRPAEKTDETTNTVTSLVMESRGDKRKQKPRHENCDKMVYHKIDEIRENASNPIIRRWKLDALLVPGHCSNLNSVLSMMHNICCIHSKSQSGRPFVFMRGN